jgi:hypothetical protein
MTTNLYRQLISVCFSSLHTSFSCAGPRPRLNEILQVRYLLPQLKYFGQHGKTFFAKLILNKKDLVIKRPDPMSRPVFVDVRGYNRFKDERCLHLHGGCLVFYIYPNNRMSSFTSLPKETSVDSVPLGSVRTTCILKDENGVSMFPQNFCINLFVGRHYMTSQMTTI